MSKDHPGVSDLPQAQADDLCWIATLQADKTHRWVSADVSLTVGDQETDVMWGLVTDEPSEAVDRSPSSGTLSVWFADHEAMLAAMPHLPSSVGELALCPVFDGTCRWEDRLVTLGGRVSDVEVDPDTLSLSVSFMGLERQDRADLSPASRTVTPDSFPQAPEDSQGSRYPLVIGRPGSFEFSTVTDVDYSISYTYDERDWTELIRVKTPIRSTRLTGATPALAVDVEIVDITLPYGAGSTGPIPVQPRYLLISAGHVEASSVTIWSKMDKVGWYHQQYDTIHAWDGIGQPVSLVDLGSGLAVNVEVRSAGEWWCSWGDGGGAIAPSGRLGDAVVEVLRLSRTSVDWPSVLRLKSYLDLYSIGTFVDDSVSPLQWVTDRVRPCGISPRWGFGGFGLALSVPTSDTSPVASISLIPSSSDPDEVEGDGFRMGPLRIAPPESSEVTVSWASNKGSKKRSMTTTVRDLAAVSQVEDGARADEVQAAECWDSTSAIRLGEVALRAKSHRWEIAASLEARQWWWLRAGDVVSLTDHGLGIDGEAWQVVEARHTCDQWRPLVLRRVEAVRPYALEVLEQARD